jgi:hypothetical protein
MYCTLNLAWPALRDLGGYFQLPDTGTPITTYAFIDICDTVCLYRTPYHTSSYRYLELVQNSRKIQVRPTGARGIIFIDLAPFVRQPSQYPPMVPILYL